MAEGKILQDFIQKPMATLETAELGESAPFARAHGWSPDNLSRTLATGGKSDYTPDEGFFHPWKTFSAPSDPISWDVIGDPVWTQGGPIMTLDFATAGKTNVVGDTGFILLKITRDVASREVTAVNLEFNALVPTSDHDHQYLVISYVDSEGDEPIVQRQLEELHIFEDLAVVNGEFMLVDLLLASRNIYELPPT